METTIKTKRCPRCKLIKTTDQFYTVKTRPDGIGVYCSLCSREKSRLRTKHLTAFDRKKLSGYKKKVRISNKTWIVNKLGNKCLDCNETFPLCVYDFHHLNPKEKDIEPGLLLGRSRKVIEKKLSKCVLLCSNCHRIRHHEGNN